MPFIAQRRARLVAAATVPPRGTPTQTNGYYDQLSWDMPHFGIFTSGARGFSLLQRINTYTPPYGNLNQALIIWSTPSGERATFPALSDVYRDGFITVEQGDIVNYLDFAEGNQDTRDTHRNRWFWPQGTAPHYVAAWQVINNLDPVTVSLWLPLDDWHYPADRWLVDWAGDGAFAHASADVSADVEGYEYQYGLQVQPNLPNLPISAADGELRLRNRDGRYTAASVSAVSAARLRQRTLARHVNSAGRVLWEGYVEPPKAANEDGVSYADFPLAGKSREQLNESTYRVYTSANNQQVFRDVCGDVGLTVGDVRSDSIPTGQTIVNGTASHILRQVRAYSGGWVFERQDGALSLVSSFGLSRDADATLESDAYAILKAATVQTDEEGVRNRGFAREITTKPSGTQTVFLDAITVQPGAFWSRKINVIDAIAGAVTYDQLTVATTPSPLPAGVSAATSNVVDDSFQITVNNTSTSPATLTLTITARVFTITQAEEREINRAASQAAYGTQTILSGAGTEAGGGVLPAWYTEAALGYAERELNRLSQPLIYATLPLPRSQRTRISRDQLQSLDAGDLVNLSIEEAGTIVSRTMIIAGIRRWQNAPHAQAMAELGLVELWNESAAAGNTWVLGVSVLGQNDSGGTWVT